MDPFLDGETTLAFEFESGETGFPHPSFTPDEPLARDDDGTYADVPLLVTVKAARPG